MYGIYTHALVLCDPLDMLLALQKTLENLQPHAHQRLATATYDAETLLEYVGKIKNSLTSGDVAGVFLAAPRVVEYCQRLLRALNPVEPYAGERAGYDRLLNLPLVPPGYRDDIALCLGTVEGPAMLRPSRRQPCTWPPAPCGCCPRIVPVFLTPNRCAATSPQESCCVQSSTASAN